MAKYLSIFEGNIVITREEHIKLFIKVLDVLNVEHEDVGLKLFYHSLRKDAIDWIQFLLATFVASYDRMEELCLSKYGDKKFRHPKMTLILIHERRMKN